MPGSGGGIMNYHRPAVALHDHRFPNKLQVMDVIPLEEVDISPIFGRSKVQQVIESFNIHSKILPCVGAFSGAPVFSAELRRLLFSPKTF